MGNRVVDFNGVSIEMTDQAASAFDALRKQHAAALAAKDESAEEAKEKLEDLEKDLAEKEAKAEDALKRLADAEARLTPAALDSLANERAALLDSAKRLAPDVDYSALDAASIKRAALEAIDVAIDGKSESYIDGAFESRAAIAKDARPSTDRSAEALVTASKTKAEDATSGRSAYMQRVSGAYRGAN